MLGLYVLLPHEPCWVETGASDTWTHSFKLQTLLPDILSEPRQLFDIYSTSYLADFDTGHLIVMVVVGACTDRDSYAVVLKMLDPVNIFQFLGASGAKR